MKKIVIFGIIATIVACVLIAGCTNVIPKSPVQITYYYSPGCHGCTLMDADFAKLEQNYKGEFVVTKYDVNKEAVKFKDDLNKYKKDSVTPFVIVGDQTFSGYNESISFYIENMIKSR